MVTYERILKKIQALNPGDEVKFRLPGTFFDGERFSYFCTVKRCAEDEVAREYSYSEYVEEDRLEVDSFFDTDDPEKVARKVYNYLTE